MVDTEAELFAMKLAVPFTFPFIFGELSSASSISARCLSFSTSSSNLVSSNSLSRKANSSCAASQSSFRDNSAPSASRHFASLSSCANSARLRIELSSSNLCFVSAKPFSKLDSCGEIFSSCDANAEFAADDSASFSCIFASSASSSSSNSLEDVMYSSKADWSAASSASRSAIVGGEIKGIIRNILLFQLCQEFKFSSFSKNEIES
mmetsp:Transcript_6970/g.7731  ORF Transcript_6970/g.7731 Transcript_6970/m.7731 type:complete len:207 (-) Transcript_6970:322-942(-)